jgi:hypothetical protein
MELSAWQQRMIFAVVVIGLAALGVYMAGPALHHKSPAAAPTPSATVSQAPAAAVATAPAPAAAVTPGGPANIYNWLPFTQAQLTDAAAVVTTFSSAYATYRYTEGPAAYIGRMNGLASGSLAGVLRADYTTGGVQSSRISQRQTSTGNGVIDSLRSFGASSITFVVTISQKITGTKGESSTSTQYAITVVPNGPGWLVNDIELASAGNT